MNWLGSLIGSATATGVSETLNGVGEAAIKIREAITGDLPPEKRAELTIHLADIEARLAEAQGKVNEIEAGSTSFFVAGWRPAAGWSAVIGLCYTFFAQPFFAWASLNWGWTAPPAIDTGALITLLMGMLGLGGLRTYEKIKDVHNEH
ncbi:MAG: hypothetical protein HY886_04935 [Deltaproteobacteria bacterium]|nr:hypothetical protein [Deltaproteobacteria bacterium]